ncbi:MAG: cysteine--tRNA ligase [Helicobacteraceae bacterium]|nr:cysteine--tRNA ligase [Helicobacteraceae bacterium]
MKRFFLFDSHLRSKVEFAPEFENEARIYVCGPTVYDDSHLGHARSAISFDLLRRVLTALGYKVTFARNITDIDDKILNKMAQTGGSLAEITDFYADRYESDLNALGVLPPTIEPKATAHIPQMIDLIDKLLKNGAAYQTPNGDIYFDVTKYPQYGSLSGETQEDTQARVSMEQKRGSRDFALWKAAKESDRVGYDSPYGKGRPGWHLECSAMAQTHLFRSGAKFACDIHGGGSDLFFPHHENEAAQTCCGYENALAKHWMHNGFVRIDGRKMSKSLNNSFFVKDALNIFQGEALRFYLMSVHYRAGLNYNYGDLNASKKRLDRVYRLKKRVDTNAAEAEPLFKEELIDALRDDLNISIALAAIDEMIARANDVLDKNPKDKAAKAAFGGNLKLVCDLLGVGAQDPYEWFQWGIDALDKQTIEALIAERALAKANKDYALADEIRARLNAIGVSVMDLAERAVWEKI